MDPLTAGRSDARERAVHLLYEADARAVSASEALAALPIAPDDYTIRLVEGVDDRLGDLDALLGRHARGWSVERMAWLDRAVLRVASFELLACDDVPTAVVIDEAVELAKTYSTDDSPRFVNGILAAVARDVRPDEQP
ncbi:MAG: transcription antitermination factor NusB [Acidimicrobiia bacterium]|nr:transcription antitermination factor NusB [Acidimicrobiia bacterium]